MTSGQPLSGVQVLVTRPIQQAEKWRARLEEQGAKTCSLPLLEIMPVECAADTQAIKNIILNFDHYQHAIFVSQNAVRYGCEWLHDYWPQWPIDIKFYAVGTATATALIAQGCDAIVAPGTMNTEALLALPELQCLEAEKVLIFRGQGGRPLLAETLIERGATVDYCELYTRCPPQDLLDQYKNMDYLTLSAKTDLNHWVALHSGESLKNWYDLLIETENTEALNQPILVPGDRVAEQAQLLGFTKITMAQNAADDTMLNALINAVSK